MHLGFHHEGEESVMFKQLLSVCVGVCVFLSVSKYKVCSHHVTPP